VLKKKGEKCRGKAEYTGSYDDGVNE